MSVPTLRQFVDAGLVRGDRGQRIELTALLRSMVDAYEGDYHNRVFVTPRRQGKSTAVSVLAAYELFCVPYSFVCWVSGSGDQSADTVHQKLGAQFRRVVALRERGLRFARDRLVNDAIGSTLQVIPVSEVSAPGRTISLLVFDESRGIPEQVGEVLRPSAAEGRIFAIGTPGAPRGWFWRAATDPGPRDYVRHFTERQNPAVSERFVEEERARLRRRGAWGELMYSREWEAQWVHLSENPLISPAAIEAASVDEVAPYSPVVDRVYVGCDLSTHRDLTSVVTVAVDGDRRLRVLTAWTWNPEERGPVDLGTVEREIERVWRLYRPRKILCDRFQAQYLVQRLSARGVRIEGLAVTAATNMTAFECLAELLAERRLVWRRNERLERELVGLEVRETVSGGFRVIDANRQYHRDVSFSLAIAVQAALSEPRSSMSITPLSRWWRPGEPERLEVADNLPWWRSSRELVRNRSHN